MTFEEAWALDIGTVVAVADGTPTPPGGLGNRRYNLWRSANFSGPILEKLEAGDGQPRRLRIRDIGNEVASVSYDVTEGASVTFTLVP